MPSTNTQPTESAPATRQTARSAPGHNRCRARNRSGSRCRLHSDPSSKLCPKHSLRPTDLPEDTDLSHKFGPKIDDLSTAVHVNSFLTTLVQCVVKNEISPRRAAVIGYLTNQIIRTLPAIEHELNPPTDHDPIIFDLPIPPGARATEKHAPYFPTHLIPNAADNETRDDDEPTSDIAVETVPHQAAATETNTTAQPTTPPAPPPPLTFSRSQHQPNEYPVYHDPNYDDHWFPTNDLIHPQPTATPTPATPNPPQPQRKPAT